MRNLAVAWCAAVLGFGGCGREGGAPAVPPATRPAPAKHDPAKAEALYQQGLDVQTGGDVQGAIRLFHQALEADPDCAEALNHFAWLRATDTSADLRNGAEAVRFAERACKVAVDESRPTIFAANCLDTLAAAYAEAGRFDDAVKAARRAVAMAEALNNRNAARDFTARLRLFEARKPYRQ